MQRIPGICLNGVKLPRDEVANMSPDDRRFARKVEEWVHSEPRPEKRTLLGEVWWHHFDADGDVATCCNMPVIVGRSCCWCYGWSWCSGCPN